MFKIITIKYLHILILSKFGIMKGFATFQIPVAPHVKKFLTVSFGKIYHVSSVDLLGMMLIPLFSKEIKINKKSDTNLTDSIKSNIYTISISYEYFERQGCYLSHDQIRMIGRTFDKYFREMLYTHMLVYSKNHPKKQKKCIVDFCETYGIDVEDIDPDTLYRDFYRKKGNQMEILR